MPARRCKSRLVFDGSYDGSAIRTDPLERGTINELGATGRIGFIRDVELRSALSEVVSSSNSRLQVIGYIVQRMSPQITHVDSKVVRLLPETGKPIIVEDIVPAHRIDFDFLAGCEDSQFIAPMSTIQFATRVLIRQSQEAMEEYLAVIDILGMGLSHLEGREPKR